MRYLVMLVVGCMGLLASPLGVDMRAQEPQETGRSVEAPVDLNRATAEELETLPGIGERTAERIIEYRREQGGFKKIEELMNVRGIGERSFLRLRPLVRVEPSTAAGGGRP